MMNIEDIRRHRPHRYPCLFVDRVVALEAGVSVEAYKNLSINEPFFDGHFPENLRPEPSLQPTRRQGKRGFPGNDHQKRAR